MPFTDPKPVRVRRYTRNRDGVDEEVREHRRRKRRWFRRPRQ